LNYSFNIKVKNLGYTNILNVSRIMLSNPSHMKLKQFLNASISNKSLEFRFKNHNGVLLCGYLLYWFKSIGFFSLLYFPLYHYNIVRSWNTYFYNMYCKYDFRLGCFFLLNIKKRTFKNSNHICLSRIC